MAGRVAIVVGCAVAAVLAGCGGDDDPGDASAPNTDELVASCGGVTFDSVPADPSAFPPLAAEDEAAIDLARIRGEEGFFTEYTWLVAKRSDTELSLFGEALQADLDPPYGSAHFRRDGDQWVPDGWGQCRIEVTAPGWGTAVFQVPGRPDPAATVITLDATENACASGRLPEGRAVRAIVTSTTDDSVSILVLVEPPTGDQDCQGNPSFAVEVELPEPLGDRTVVDASVQAEDDG
ncbi:MAG TPA: hypothetical protein VFG94_03410 [Acidimicrobiales bacterium]|nr:hypothetical protein [Acidimicrobiales bacterium]